MENFGALNLRFVPNGEDYEVEKTSWLIKGCDSKNVTESLSVSGHTWVMESLKPRVKGFEEENDSNNLTELRSLRHRGVAKDSVTFLLSHPLFLLLQWSSTK